MTASDRERVGGRVEQQRRATSLLPFVTPSLRGAMPLAVAVWSLFAAPAAAGTHNATAANNASVGSEDSSVNAGLGTADPASSDTADVNIGLSAGAVPSGADNVYLGTSTGYGMSSATQDVLVGSSITSNYAYSRINGLGAQSTIYSDSAVAIGADTSIAGYGGTDAAIGQGAAVGSIYDSLALGQSAFVTNTFSIALGANASDGSPLTAEIGKSGTTMRLFNVADGTSVNDAVNYEQILGVSTYAEVTGLGGSAPYTVFAGYNASASSTGSFNTYVGYSTGWSASGADNVALGSSAGWTVIGSGNTSLGISAARLLTGNDNLTIGASAGDISNYPVMINNVIIGESAASGSYGEDLIALGQYSDRGSYANENIALGASTGRQEYGAENSNLGAFSGFNADNFGVAIGDNSLGSYGYGYYNTALGPYAEHATYSNSDTAIGMYADSPAVGTANTYAGYSAGSAILGLYDLGFGASAAASVTGSYNIALGSLAGGSVIADDTIALGYSAGQVVSSNRTIALGTSARASQVDAVAVGSNASASAISAIALGISALASGTDAVALGSSATASAANAIAIGSGAVNSTANTVEFGAGATPMRLLNIADAVQLTDAINISQLLPVSGAVNVVVGNVSTVSGSDNANFTSTSAVLGTLTSAFGTSGPYTIALGESAGAAGVTGSFTTLLGYSAGNALSGNNVVALGPSAGGGANANASIAIGYAASGTQNTSIALGTSASAGAANAIAIGSGVVNTSANTVEFGSGAPSMTLTNIANAMSANDAVNVSQLQTVSGLIGAAIPAALGKIGSENVALAAGAGATQVTGSYQVAIGVSSGNSVTGTANAAIGQFAGNGIVGVINNDGYDSVSGYDNLSLGTSAGNAMSGDRNVAMGFAAGTGVVGTDNIGIGSLSGDSVTGSENIGIGLSAGHAVGHGIVGSGNTSGVTGALSLGAYASVAGADEVAMGTSAWVSGLGAAALGWSASASGNAAIAFGQGAITPIADTVTFGSSNVAERLSNLDTGVNANDAINFGQLAALTAATNTEVNSLESDLGFSPTQPTAANCCQTGAGSSNGAASTSNSASSGGTATGAQTSGNNLAVGGSALNSVVGTYATGLGYAGASLIVGDENTGAGAFASRFITGFQNTGIGFVASRLTTGTGNTGFGTSSSIFVSGDFNTGIGYASSGSVTGSGNVAFGANAGRGVVGDTTIAIGTNAGSDGALQGTQPGYTISTPVNEIAFTSGPSNVSTSAIVTSPQAAAQNIAVTTSSTLDVVGSDTIALGRDAGVGRGTGVNVTQALALGLSAAAAAPQALALGTNASTSALGGVALGLSASAGANRSVALGYASVATDADTVSVGAPSINSNFRASGSSSLATSGVSSTNSGVSAIAPTTNGSSGVTPLAPFTLGNPLAPQSIGSTTLASTAVLQPRRIVNVAAGINTSDVATYGQLTAVGNTFHALSNAVGSVNMNANRGTAMAIAQVGAQAGGASPGRTRIGFGGGYYSGVAAVGLGVTSADTTGTRMLSFGSALTPGASNFSFGIAARWRTGRTISHTVLSDDVAIALPHMRQNALTHGADLGYSAFSDPAKGGIVAAEMDPKFWQLVAQSARNSGYSDILRLSENAYIATIHGHAYRVALTKGRLHSKTRSEWRLWIERIANPDDVANGRSQRWLSPGVVAGLSRAALTARAQDLMLNDSEIASTRI